MASFVCVIAKSNPENWELCKKYNRWGIRSSPVSINHAKKIKKGDRLFIWIGGVGYVGLAESEVDEPIEVTDSTHDVWNGMDCTYIIPWKLIKEIEPELLNFTDRSQEETRIPQPWMQNGFFQIGTHSSRILSKIFDVEYREVESKFDPQNKYATKNIERYFNSTDRTIRSVVDDISYVKIQLPDLQRPFTWKTTQTTALFDSIYKGFPIGYIMLWRNSDKNISRKIATSSDSDFINELVLDGQQRLTSLYSVIKSEKVVNKKYEEVNHNVAFNPLTEKFETKNAATQNDPEFISDISELFSDNFNQTQFINNFIENIQLSKEISKDEETQIQAAVNRLCSMQNMPLQVLYLSDKVNQEDAKEIFVRINSSGTNLTHADFLLTLISVRWKEGREAISEFVKEQIKNNENITPDATQIIRSIGMLAFKIARVEAIYNKMDEADDEELIQFQKAQNTSLNSNNWNDYLNCISEAGFISN